MPISWNLHAAEVLVSLVKTVLHLMYALPCLLNPTLAQHAATHNEGSVCICINFHRARVGMARSTTANDTRARSSGMCFYIPYGGRCVCARVHALAAAGLHVLGVERSHFFLYFLALFRIVYVGSTVAWLYQV